MLKAKGSSTYIDISKDRKIVAHDGKLTYNV